MPHPPTHVFLLFLRFNIRAGSVHKCLWICGRNRTLRRAGTPVSYGLCLGSAAQTLGRAGTPVSSDLWAEPPPGLSFHSHQHFSSLLVLRILERILFWVSHCEKQILILCTWLHTVRAVSTKTRSQQGFFLTSVHSSEKLPVRKFLPVRLSATLTLMTILVYKYCITYPVPLMLNLWKDLCSRIFICVSFLDFCIHYASPQCSLPMSLLKGNLESVC